MKNTFLFGLILVVLSGLVSEPLLFARSSERVFHADDAEHLKEIQGEILRLYEDRGNEWGSYILLRDLMGEEKTIYVHPVMTLVRRNEQILELSQITGGMKATIIYQKSFRDARAVSVSVSGIFYG